MKKLLEIQEQYIEAFKEHVSKSVELLNAAKNAMGNYIGSCDMSVCKRCTPEKKCNFCEGWSKVWDDIDAYLKDNK